MVTIEVVMITHNRLGFLTKSLPDLLANLPESATVRVCAQACTDGTNEWLRGVEHPRLGVEVRTHGIGLARQKELVDSSKADIIVTCDDDVWSISPGWAEKFAIALTSPQRIGYVCAVPTNGLDGGMAPEALRSSIPLAPDVTFYPTACGGWFAATTRRLLDRVGGFPAADRSRFDVYDALYAAAVLRAGHRFGAIAEVTVHHAHSIRAKVAAGFAEQVRDNLREAHRAGWLTAENLAAQEAEIDLCKTDLM